MFCSPDASETDAAQSFCSGSLRSVAPACDSSLSSASRLALTASRLGRMPYASDQGFKEWQWTHSDPLVVQRARQLLSDFRGDSWARKSAVIWDTWTDIEGGFALQWHVPAKRNVAQRWFWARFVQEVVACLPFLSHRISEVRTDGHAVFADCVLQQARILCVGCTGQCVVGVASTYWPNSENRAQEVAGLCLYRAPACSRTCEWPTCADEQEEGQAAFTEGCQGPETEHWPQG